MVARQVSELRTSTIGSEQESTSWQQRFLQLLPRIRAQAQIQFRHLPPEAREDATAEIIANSLVSYARLVGRHQEDRAYATPLARYAVAQCREGRRVGSPLNALDVSSAYCQREKGVTVERLDRFEARSGNWQEITVEDRRSGPAEVAATRIDFAAWLESLPARMRSVAEMLATGETTACAAQILGLSASRISQLRRELYDGWRLFQGDDVAENSLALV